MAGLVLSREREQIIKIGDDVEVEVLDICGGKVRLQVRAPQDVSVHRKEVYDAILAENRAAARVLDPRRVAMGEDVEFIRTHLSPLEELHLGVAKTKRLGGGET